MQKEKQFAGLDLDVSHSVFMPLKCEILETERKSCPCWRDPQGSISTDMTIQLFGHEGFTFIYFFYFTTNYQAAF